ncbi:MAG: hypothetical protein OER12_02700 [Acidimicrobiia bacterium]|nr:hypothetical protein [Acidimicrobiia bacterium]
MDHRVERYEQASSALDTEALGKLRHPEYQCYYPQSGERFLTHDAWASAHENYSSHFGAEADPVFETTHGGEAKTEVITASPGFGLPTPMIQISDSGNLATMEGKGVWPDGKTYNLVAILEFRDGLVWRETQYFAEPFDPPEWRAAFVEVDPRS